jgi:LL-diaminopimelate aminotransferase
MKRHEPKYLILNYPHNPTAAVCPRETLTSIVDLCHRFDCFLCYDNAYSEVYFSDKARPISALEIPGAKDITIEFQTLSKTFNMTGWRLAFAVGSEKLVQPLRNTKTHIDSGPFPATQEAGAWALEEYQQLTEPLRQMYAERRKVALHGLDRLHIEYLPPAATFYIWCRVPDEQPSMEFCRQLIEQQGLVITPGIGFGPEGEGFFRLALTVDVPRIEEAMHRLAVFLGRS